MALLPLAIAAVTITALGATPAHAATPTPGPSAAPKAAVTQLSPAYYDARYKVIVVPYSGPVPTYTQGSLGDPPRVFLDFQARFKGGFPSGKAVGHPNLEKWAMAGRGASTRLTLTFKEPTKVRVLHNAKRHLLVLVPQPVAASPSPSQSPGPQAPSPGATPAPASSPGLGATLLGPPRYDGKAVVLPYEGPVPTHVSATLTGPPRMYFDFEGAYRLRNQPGGVVSDHASLTRWVLSPRDADTTRVTLTFKAPTRVLLQVDEARREIRLVPQGPGAPSPAPSATPTPRRTPAPTPTPAPTLEPPRLTPSEKPTPLDSP